MGQSRLSVAVFGWALQGCCCCCMSVCQVGWVLRADTQLVLVLLVLLLSGLLLTCGLAACTVCLNP